MPKKRRGGEDLDLGLGPRTAVIYTRVSDTTEENNEFSHEYQEAACRAKAESLGYTVIEVFRDNFSGKYLYERPGLSRLRELVRAGGVHAVFFWKLDRISRKLPQRAILIQELREIGCVHLSATEEISDTPEGRLLEAVLGAIAEFELERTLERSQATLSLLRDRGTIICQGLARYGYRYVKETRSREIVEAEAQWVRKIFEWYLTGDSADLIANRLTALGVPTPANQRGVKLKGGPARQWHASTVRAILKDASYTGAPMVSGRKRNTGDVNRNGNAITVRTPESEWWTASVPTPMIIPRADFDRAQEILGTRATFIKTRNGVKPYLLRGRVKCAVCGMTMSPQTTVNAAGKAYHYFACISTQLKRRCGNKGTPVEWLDQLVWDKVVEYMEDDGKIEQGIEQLAQKNRVDDLERDHLAHQAAIATARGGLKRLVERLEITDDPELVRAIEERLAELRATIAAHQEEMATLEAKLRLHENQAAAIQRAKETRSAYAGKLKEGASFEERRELIDALDVQVRAKKKDVHVKMGLQLVNSDDSPGSAASPTSPAAPAAAPGDTTTRP
jgi:site-specific DNA recombinase